MEHSASSEAPVRGGILLAGPPSSGKRTVAFALTSLRRSYAHVPALSTTPDPSVDAEQVTSRHLDELRSWAQVFHEFTVDGTRYAYDRERLVRLRDQGRIPVVCVEDGDALDPFDRESAGWLPVLVWRPHHGKPVRSLSRRWQRSSTGLLADRTRFTLTVRSDRLGAVEIAQIVHLAVQASTSDVEQRSGR